HPGVGAGMRPAVSAAGTPRTVSGTECVLHPLRSVRTHQTPRTAERPCPDSRAALSSETINADSQAKLRTWRSPSETKRTPRKTTGPCVCFERSAAPNPWQNSEHMKSALVGVVLTVFVLCAVVLTVESRRGGPTDGRVDAAEMLKAVAPDLEARLARF